MPLRFPLPTGRPPLRPVATWLGLLAASLVLSAAFQYVRLPAALLIGPMVAAIAFGVAGAGLRVPRRLFTTAQGVVGCLIAHAITAAVLVEVGRDWPEMTLAVATTVAASAAVGWALARLGAMPAATAAWGSSAGAASAMSILAEEYGADGRLVAFMQYVRVICVVVIAAFVSRLLVGSANHPAAVPATASASAWGDPLGLAWMLVLAVGGSWLGGRIRMPAGGLMMPMLLGATGNAAGFPEIALPEALLAAAYTGVGWYIGLQFNPVTLRHALRALPAMVASAFALIVLCWGSAWLLVRLGRTDPLTAFLATTPGGLDTVAIIAIGSGGDVAFVLALQTLRIVVVLLTGPPVARWIARTAVRT